MFLDAILEMANNVTAIFKSQEYFTTKHNIPQSLYANTEEAQVNKNFINFLPF